MNYIQQLQEENTNLKKSLLAGIKSLNDFKVFLNSPKFVGTENGENKDWINTGDVLAWINTTTRELPIAETLEDEIKTAENKIKQEKKCGCTGTFHDDSCALRIK